MLEVVLRLLDFVLVIDVAVGHPVARSLGPDQVEDVFHPCRYIARRSMP
jgi:hypothetical protein